MNASLTKSYPKGSMTSKSRRIAFALVACLACVHGWALAADAHKTDGEDNELSVDISYDTSSGIYGSPNFSSERSWTSTISYDTDNYSFSLALPYVYMSGPVGVTRRRSGKLVTETDIVNASGYGDIEVSVTRYVLDEEDAGMDLAIKGTVKLPTASQSKGLGTGVTDSFVELDFGKTFGNFTATATFGYSFLGNAGIVRVQGVQQNLTFKNVFSASLDGALRLNDSFMVGVTRSGQDASSIGMPDSKDIKVYLGYKANKSVKIRAYALKGLSDASPDNGFGMSATINF